MSISSSEAMAMDRGDDLLDAVMHGTRDRRWVLAAIGDKYPLDQEDGHGRNAFAWAAAKGFVPEMKAMMARGVWCEHADEQGQTPLIMAAEGGHFDAIKLLVESEVQVDARDKSGHSAADYSLTKGFNEITAYLIGAGATPPPVDVDTELKQPAAVFSRPLSHLKK
jgi:hypothetical protein